MIRATQASLPPQLPPELSRYITPTAGHAEFIAQAHAYLAALADWLRETNPLLGRQVLTGFTAGHDALVAAALHHEQLAWTASTGRPAPPLALVALGGYGRRALCLLSDVDLLFLLGSEEAGELAAPLVRLLTDCRLRLGHSARTVEHCLERIDAGDFDSTTSMLEARLIAGPRPLFQRFTSKLRERISGPARRWYLDCVYRQWRSRREQYESTVYLLEPNIKEGEGGLRDLHSVQWALQALAGTGDLHALLNRTSLDKPALDRYRRAADVLHTVRNELHLASGQKQDRLQFAWQATIARRLGFEPDPIHSPEELFMGYYYRHARVIDGTSRRAMRELARPERWLMRTAYGSPRRRALAGGWLVEGNELHPTPAAENGLAEDPRRALALMQKAALRGWRLSDPALDALARLARGLGEDFARDPAVSRRFLALLGSPGTPDQVLADMHECGLLEAIIPEFERVRAMVRIDHYHHYTVDEHTLKALEVARRLRAGQIGAGGPLGQIAARVERWDLLALALLLHDVGKGYGRGHALRGGQIAQRVCDRLGLAADDAETVRFLVLGHLKLSHAAQRRDPSDPSVARQLAAEIGSLERLRLLFIHTICDLMAVSPAMWSDWKEHLLLEAYMRTAEVLGEHHDMLAHPRPNRTLVRHLVLESLPEQARALQPEAAPALALDPALQAEVEKFLNHTSDRYIQTVAAPAIARHFLIRRALAPENPIAWHLVPDGGQGLSELSVCAIDVPGLFHSICGALAAKGFNIWSAQIFSTTAGEAINQFQLTDLENRPLPAGLRLERLRRDLAQVIQGHRTIEQLIERHKGRPRRLVHPPRPKPTMVLFDNGSSKSTTIIEIRTADRPGLLYQITGALMRQRLDIQRAIIATEAYGVVDVFFVTDLEFNKIYDEPTQKQIESAILEAIDAPGIH